MKFYQYWIIIITIVLVLLSIINIAKMIMLINKDNSKKIEKNKELDVNIRNLLVSIALLSITSLIYIILIFIQSRWFAYNINKCYNSMRQRWNIWWIMARKLNLN